MKKINWKRILLNIILPIIGSLVGVLGVLLIMAEARGCWPFCSSIAPVDVRIIDAQFDVPGKDTIDKLNDEWVLIKNSSDTDIDMSGWKLKDYQENHTYTFGDFMLLSNATVKIHTGVGINTPTELYWGHDYFIWDNDGDTATLFDNKGEQINEYTE